MLWLEAARYWFTQTPRGIKAKNAGKAAAKGAGFVALIATATSTLQRDIERRDSNANEKMNRIEIHAIDAVKDLTKLVDEREDQRKTDTKELKETTKRIEAWVFTLTQEFRAQRAGDRRPDSISQMTPPPLREPWRIASGKPVQESKEN